MTQLPVPVYERDVEEMFQVVDTDRDGRISYQEFCVSFVEIHRVKEGLKKTTVFFFSYSFEFPPYKRGKLYAFLDVLDHLEKKKKCYPSVENSKLFSNFVLTLPYESIFNTFLFRRW